jgi:hypothetical protein
MGILPMKNTGGTPVPPKTEVRITEEKGRKDAQAMLNFRRFVTEDYRRRKDARRSVP